MMKSPLIFILWAFVAVSPLPGAVTTWINGGNDSSWINPLNWSNGVPINTSDVQVGTLPTDNLIGLDTGSGTNVINSLTINSVISSAIDFLAAGPETLTVSGNIVNNATGSGTISFQLPVMAGGDAAYSAGSGELAFGALDINTRTVATSGNVSALSLSFTINSLFSYGSIGSIDVSGGTISVTGPYTGGAGDTFDLTTGNFSGATISQLPTLEPGLFWNTSLFLSAGILTVVPEPSIWLLLGLGTFLLGWNMMRRPSAAVLRIRRRL